jgi:hypothetical protein
MQVASDSLCCAQHKESETIFIAGLRGGQTLQKLGNTKNFCNFLLMFAGKIM